MGREYLNDYFLKLLAVLVLTFFASSSCIKIEREPKVETGQVSDITNTTANATGDIIDLGEGITDCGHCWSSTSNPPTISDSKTALGATAKTGPFTSELINLQPGTIHYLRAYARSGDKIVYGNEVLFNTSIELATLTTIAVTSITNTVALSGGNISFDGGSTVTERGVCWGTAQNPTINNSKTSDGTGTGSFTSNLTGLTANTTYYVRAYAMNSAGAAYGNEISFTTCQAVNAGLGGSACNLFFTLSAVSSTGIGTWTMTSGTGTASFTPNANSPTATVAVSGYGTKVFTWTVNNSSCSSSSDVTVNFYEQPLAYAGSGGNNCGLEYYLGALPSIGTGTWTRLSGPGSFNFSPNAYDPNAKVTVSSYGVHVFRWTEVNETCTSSSTVTVTFVEQPSANAGIGGEEYDKDFIFNAVPGTGTSTWTMISGPGQAIFSPNANQADATVTVTQFGTYDFAWIVVNEYCSSTDIIRVGFHDIP